MSSSEREPMGVEQLLGAAGVALSFGIDLLGVRSFMSGSPLVGCILHGVAAGTFAAALPFMISRRSIEPMLSARLSMFLVVLFIPGLGILGLGLGLIYASFARPPPATESLRYIFPPPLPLRPLFLGSGAPLRFSEGALALVLRNAPDPDKRVAAVMALRRMADARATPLLRIALKDPVDDVRLLAYALTDAIDKELNRRINRRLAVLQDAPPKVRARLLKALAQDYWDIAFLGLASADIEKHVLSEAANYLEKSLELRPDGGAALLLGRVRLRQNRPVEAEAAFSRARALGLPSVSVGPYRAEAAFLNRDFEGVRRRLGELPTTSRARLPIAEAMRFWLGSSTEDLPEEDGLSGLISSLGIRSR